MIDTKLWERCTEFHGHVCGGLIIGYQAAIFAKKLLDIDFSKDEEVVCISENDACGVDAIQVVLGCSIGKGNLLFHMRGKQAFSFYNRKNGKSVRLVLKPIDCKMTREESFKYYQNHSPEEIFEVKSAVLEVPERARIFESTICECCHEKTSNNMIRIQNKKKVCLDCYKKYDRFNV